MSSINIKHHTRVNRSHIYCLCHLRGVTEEEGGLGMSGTGLGASNEIFNH